MCHIVSICGPTKLATSNTEAQTCSGGLIDRTCASTRIVWTGCRATGYPSQDEWALWGAVGCHRPSATKAGPGHWSSLGAYRGRDVTKAGMRGTMVHSLTDALKQLGVSAFNRRGRLPLYGPQSIVCFPPQTEKVVFCEWAAFTIMWWPFPPQPAVSISWMDYVADIVYMFVCWLSGEAAEEESNPLRHIARGRTHTAYHKGASGRENVYMMSSDGPNIGLHTRKKKMWMGR